MRCFADASPPAPRAVSTASSPSRPRLTERPVPFPATSTNSESGKYVKSLVFGGLDGIITTFAVVAASVGGSLNTDVILLMGFANLIADGLSMGFGDYLSSQAEFEYTRAEHKREKWELDNYPEGEKQEMVELYVKRGMTQADAESVIEVMSKYKNFFLDVMMVEELGLMPPDESDSPAKNGLVTFLAFVFFGFIPLTSYVLAGATGASDRANFVVACLLHRSDHAGARRVEGAVHQSEHGQERAADAAQRRHGRGGGVPGELGNRGGHGGGQRDVGRETRASLLQTIARARTKTLARETVADLSSTRAKNARRRRLLHD